MAKTLDQKQRFIELRGNGLSYAKIAAELDVSKSTLIEWGKDEYNCKQIQNLKALYQEELAESYGISVKGRLELLSKLQSRFHQELEARDLSTIPTDKLIGQIYKLEDMLGSYAQSSVILQEGAIFSSNTSWFSRES